MSEKEPMKGRERAEFLVRSFAREIGAGDRTLGPDGDVSFGDVGFRYDHSAKMLMARVYIARAIIKDAPDPADIENYRKVAKALNAPDIGGRFERAGGYFVLDEDKEMYFLVRDFEVDTLTPAAFRETVRELRDVGVFWTTRWFARVARIAHGHEAPPAGMVTRE